MPSDIERARAIMAAATPGLWDDPGRGANDRAASLAVTTLPALLAVMEAARAQAPCVDHADYAGIAWCEHCQRGAREDRALCAAIDAAEAKLAEALR